ncbi:hypothetical protein, variant [Aphanomyces invadans]|uniref:Uncharacterized protein n=1 Tax=Aphanomyces invadans TaxID=157072 RepID=A0A024U046_9STRA|nr:hypothetical protein, variant [Aphanomyces invadans]ETV99785.1 hypothetical protein, variant [Aphanomyces invadans]|eukprot:XP_008871561.1 hypothetical protein, variant [Aphanomyces invadans]
MVPPISSTNNNASDVTGNETWSLLLDDKRIRLACESALIPPLEALYAPSVQMSLDLDRPTAFFITFGTASTNDDDDSDRHVAHLHVDLHDCRDVILLVFQAFSARAMRSTALADAISTGQSCMLACRTLPSTSSWLSLSPVDGYALPWRQSVSLDSPKARQVSTRTTTPPLLTISTSLGDGNDDVSLDLNSTLLQDVDELLELTHQLCLHDDISTPASTPTTSSRSSTGTGLAGDSRQSVVSAATFQDDDNSNTSMHSALESIKAERRALQRQLDHLRRHHPHHVVPPSPTAINPLI